MALKRLLALSMDRCGWEWIMVWGWNVLSKVLGNLSANKVLTEANKLFSLSL
jgi:hypothetical protein